MYIRPARGLAVCRCHGVARPAITSALAPEHVVTTAVLSGLAPDNIAVLADELAHAARQVPGIADAWVDGRRAEEVEVVVDPDRLKALGWTPEQVLGVLRQERWDVTRMATYTSVEELSQISLGSEGLRLADVASVQYVRRSQGGDVWLNGALAVAVTVVRRPEADVPALEAALRSAWSAKREAWPAEVKVTEWSWRDKKPWVEAEISTQEAAHTLMDEATRSPGGRWVVVIAGRATPWQLQTARPRAGRMYMWSDDVVATAELLRDAQGRGLVQHLQVVSDTTRPRTLRVEGPDLEVLLQVADDLVRRLRQDPAILSTQHDSGPLVPTSQIRLDRGKVAALAGSSHEVSRQLRMMRERHPVGAVRDGDRQISASLRVSGSENPEEFQAFAQMTIRLGGAEVPLSAIATVEQVAHPEAIHRLDHRRVVTVTVAPRPGGDPDDVREALRREVAETTLPSGVIVQIPE